MSSPSGSAMLLSRHSPRSSATSVAPRRDRDRMLKQILSVGGWTLVSRVTGFARDVVLAAVMGVGPVADAFVVALRIPNHFRAIFGEGAFNSAFVPTYAKVLEQEGAPAARSFANRITTLMLIVQVILLGVALAAMPFVVIL